MNAESPVLSQRSVNRSVSTTINGDRMLLLRRREARNLKVVYHGRARLAAERGEPMKTRNHGFTMLEMMAVVAVVAILAMLAVPPYLDFVVRDQIKAALPLADIAKQPIAAGWPLTQTFPADNAAAGLPPAEKVVANYVSGLAVEDGAIHITFGNRANKAIAGKILTLRPAVVEDAPVVPVAWVCGYAEGPDKMTIHGKNLTNVPQPLLPIECRAFKP
jgi:type IV pilus assembly protein PilA